MDELRFKQRRIASRSMRRLALLTLINCAFVNGTLVGAGVTHCSAEDQQVSTNGLRSLISDGWTEPMPSDKSVLMQSPTLGSATVKLRREAVASTSDLPRLPPVATLAATGPNATGTKEATASDSGLADGAYVIRLKPIKIDEAQEISVFEQRQPASSSRYADLPARTIANKSKPTVAKSQAIPKLPPPNASTTPDKPSAFALPQLQASKPGQMAPGQMAEPEAHAHAKPLGRSFDDLKSDALRTIADGQGFSLIGTSDAAPSSRSLPQAVTTSRPLAGSFSSSKVNSAAPEPSAKPTIHAGKLGEIAAVQLRDAEGRLRRGATHSAKRLVIEALRNLVAYLDVQQGDNVNARHLDAALTAIRESEDFTGKFGAVDQRALQRLVVAHKTSVLKNRDLSHVSPLRATEAYLAIAREEIVVATASVGMASDALVLLGRIESAMASSTDPRGGALALSLQQAAVEVDPANSRAWLALGKTMLKEGLAGEAVAVLSRSVEIQPSRSGYEQLLVAARHVQDQSTAEHCMMALRNPHLQRQVPVRRIDQEAFAAMYKPTNSIARNANDLNQREAASESVASKNSADAKPVSTKNKRFGLLRSWVMPKKNR